MIQSPPLFRNQLLANVLSTKREYLLNMVKYNPILTEDKTHFIETAIQATYGTVPTLTARNIRYKYEEMPITLQNGRVVDGVELTFIVDYEGSLEYFGFNPTSMSGSYRPDGSVNKDNLGLVYHTDDPATDFDALLKADLAIIETFLAAIKQEVEADVTSLRPLLYDHIDDKATKSAKFREAISKLPYRRI